METVTLKPLFHKNKECIAIHSIQSATLNYYFQKKGNAKWSKTNKCWYIPCNEKDYMQLANALKGKAIINGDELKKYLEKKKNSTSENLRVPVTVIQHQKTFSQKIISQNIQQVPSVISNENKEAFQQFHQQLVLKSYSASTIRTYSNEYMQFLQLIKDKPAKGFTVQRIKDYLQYCHTTLKLSENTLHSRINALKFYYEQVLKREKFFWEIPRPKKPLLLPKVLGEDELRKLFNAITFKKHKAILFTAYSAGLRVSEVVNLQLKHIDRSRMQLFIEKSKGKKDRYVGLSVILLDILESYYKEVKPKPVKYLFEGENPGVAYHSRSAQKVFQMAKHKAGINKEIGFHSLRHSFATHLLEKGIDIKYIKDLLGHFDIRTTERYLHVKKEKLINIVSPLDDLWQKEEIDW